MTILFRQMQKSRPPGIPDRTAFGLSNVRVVAMIDALWVEISDGGCHSPMGGPWKYLQPGLWAVCVVAGSSVGATPPSEKLLRN